VRNTYNEIKATLDPLNLKDFERKLFQSTSDDFEPSYKVFSRTGSFSTREKSSADDATKEDILSTYKNGISISPVIESQPLIHLFKAQKIALPAKIKVDHEQMNYDFYLAQIIFNVLLPQDQFPDYAEFTLTIKDDVKESVRQTRPVQLFPAEKHKDLFKIDVEGGVGVDAKMDLSIPVTNGLPISKFDVGANMKANFVVGPFDFRFSKAAIEVVGESSQNIIWRYNMESEISGKNMFKSFLVLKIAKEAKDVKISALLKIRPWKSKWLGIGHTELPTLDAYQKDMTVELVQKSEVL
jgi:hypothetical protein